MIITGKADKPLTREDISRLLSEVGNTAKLNLSYQNLSEIDLTKFNLRRANLRGADLRKADLRSADLRKANLQGADLEGAHFEGTNLSRANLSDTNLNEVDLRKTNLRGTILKTDLRKAMLNSSNALSVKYDRDKENYESRLVDWLYSSIQFIALLAHFVRTFKELNTALRKADLRGANLSGLNLSKADLRGAKLQEAELFGTDLSEANLHKAKLSKATLSRANLLKADLSKADLFEADLERANLYGSQLRGANLGKSVLREAYLINANLYKADLRKADLREASLGSAILSLADLSKATISNAHLQRAKMRRSKLIGSDLFSVDLTEADLSHANLSKSILNKAHLREAKFRNANLSEATFIEADLCGADLYKTNLIKAKLDKANLSRVDLRRANFSQVSIANASLTADQKKYLSEKLPKGLEEINILDTRRIQTLPLKLDDVKVGDVTAPDNSSKSEQEPIEVRSITISILKIFLNQLAKRYNWILGGLLISFVLVAFFSVLRGNVLLTCIALIFGILIFSLGIALKILLSSIHESISYEVISNTSLGLRNVSPIFGDLPSINQQISDLHLITIRLWNSGTVPILHKDFTSPISFDFGERARILDAEALLEAPYRGKVSLNLETKMLKVNPPLLNGKDSILLKALVSHGGDEVKVYGHIYGIDR